MFANLIESQSHGKEFKRRGRFVIATAFAYTVVFFVAGIVSSYAYDARVESQIADDLTVLSWMPPVTPPVDHVRVQAVHRAPPSNNNRISQRPERPILYESASSPLNPPDQISAEPNPIPPAPPGAIIGSQVSDIAAAPNSSNCVTCTGSDTPSVPRVVEATPPIPTPPKPQTQSLPSRVLASKAISLPQPPYPPLAKQVGIQGAVQVQILVDETGKVISAHAVSGSSFLTTSAVEAARRARFTPTLLNDQPVKVQGTIIYNFVLQ